MGINSANKTINVDQIDCDGTIKVTLSLSASPNISSHPTDIVLILDRSGSMSGRPLTNMKAGAKKFIDIIDEATDNTLDGEIGLGSRIGIVSFADTATKNTQLITSVSELKDAVNSLSAGGFTNHADAFTKAIELFDPASMNQKVMVMFTDGKTTVGAPPAPIAEAARAAGIVIYCIGLTGSDGIDISVLNDWATDPDDSHVVVTPDDAELEELFENLANNISKPGATGIVIDEIINSDFSIVHVQDPTKGTVNKINSSTLQWKIDKLGVTNHETASLEFIIKHNNTIPGVKMINQSIQYHDKEDNKVIFPEPKVNVTCGIVTHPEPCPMPVKVEIEGCKDSIIYDVGDVYLESLGRILQLNINLKNVCPHKRIALAVILDEVDKHGVECQRGVKIMTVPAHNAPTCRDVLVKCIKFVLPEDLASACGGPTSICSTRNFKVRVIAHPIDSDFECCNIVI